MIQKEQNREQKRSFSGTMRVNKMKAFSGLLAILIVLSALSASSQGQSLEDGWLGILPLMTTKEDVEKKLGKPKIDENGYHGYRFEGGFIQVNYSTAPCKANPYNRGKYNIESDTVLDYTVNLHDGVRLSELKFDREAYRKEESTHGGNLYIRRDNSIWITTFTEGGQEYAVRLDFRAGNLESAKWRCPSGFTGPVGSDYKHTPEGDDSAVTQWTF